MLFCLTAKAGTTNPAHANLVLSKIMYEEIIQKFKKLETKLSDPAIISDLKQLKNIASQHAELKKIIEIILPLKKIQADIKEHKDLIALDADPELKAMAEQELPDLRKQYDELKLKIKARLRPADPRDKKNIIMEIRAGTGGDESALFASDLFRMYSRFAEKQGWKLNILNSNQTGIGGYKEIIALIKGKNVFSYLKYEGGTHRVQRIPETEKQGRVHTSAATVAVMPEAEEMDLNIKTEDIRVDIYSASGPGGQSVNTSNSAVRVTHLPTGLIAQCQDQKSQHQNKDKAMSILRSRLLAKLEKDQRQNEAAQRKNQIGTGDRSEKIRTYNFPQDRITDHRIKKSWSNINSILDGNLDNIIHALQEADG